MKDASLEVGSGAKLLSQALRAIRKKRGMTVSEVAGAMAMPRRTYEEFGGGRGPVTHERIFAFAEATNSDPYALILAVDFKMPQFAIDCADTKLALILMIHLHDFATAEGGDITYLEPTNIIGAAERLFGDLSAKLSNSEVFLQNWLDKRTGSIGFSALRTRTIKRKPREGE
ncbi:helix-turn-helix domain-containing protein [Sphingomonas nostoxanthinifaciens]|uniref:helix-turn-helix domain-containing protein n=1 Tax=Sphingomonas nostoxanthinifaciens TaxID=2872652 RepID=UPI001CC1D342|nr:helix-turn-helix transcriptional regulator [Sphingomonas nostoxanthinifaciens]UAK25472.1 helix-turn-helix domain-containing protein [Sphingomonas nostoxanthinifaciens]